MKVEKPIYGKDSYSARCDDLFADDHGWDASDVEGVYQRAVGWYSAGTGFAIREVARAIDDPEVRHIAHGMFYVAMLAVDAETDTRRYSQWFVVHRLDMLNEEVWHTTHHAVSSTSDAQSLALADSLFSLQNGFAAPNEEDLLQLGMLIELGSHEQLRRMTY